MSFKVHQGVDIRVMSNRRPSGSLSHLVQAWKVKSSVFLHFPIIPPLDKNQVMPLYLKNKTKQKPTVWKPEAILFPSGNVTMKREQNRFKSLCYWFQTQLRVLLLTLWSPQLLWNPGDNKVILAQTWGWQWFLIHWLLASRGGLQTTVSSPLFQFVEKLDYFL